MIANGSKEKSRIALPWVTLSICSSVRPDTASHTASGEFGHVVSEWG